MSNGLAKTNSEDSKLFESLLPEAIADLNQELANRLRGGRSFFGSVRLEVLFQEGKPQTHRITIDYTGKPKSQK